MVASLLVYMVWGRPLGYQVSGLPRTKWVVVIVGLFEAPQTRVPAKRTGLAHMVKPPWGQRP